MAEADQEHVSCQDRSAEPYLLADQKHMDRVPILCQGCREQKPGSYKCSPRSFYHFSRPQQCRALCGGYCAKISSHRVPGTENRVPGMRMDFGAIASLFPGNLTRLAAGLPPMRARYGTIHGPQSQDRAFFPTVCTDLNRSSTFCVNVWSNRWGIRPKITRLVPEIQKTTSYLLRADGRSP